MVPVNLVGRRTRAWTTHEPPTKRIRPVYKWFRNGRKYPRSVLTLWPSKRSRGTSIDIIVHRSKSTTSSNWPIAPKDTEPKSFSTKKISRRTLFKWVRDLLVMALPSNLSPREYLRLTQTHTLKIYWQPGTRRRSGSNKNTTQTNGSTRRSTFMTSLTAS